MRPTREERDVLAVRQVNRVQIVKRAVGELPHARPVGIDLVEVEGLFVVRLEAEQNPLAVERNVRAPERAVARKRLLRREHRLLAGGRKPFQDHQPPARDRLRADAVVVFVPPLRAGRVRNVHVNYRVEVDRRVGEHDPALDLTDSEVRTSRGVRLGQRVQLPELVLEIDPLDPGSERFRVPDLVPDHLRRDVPAALEKPLLLECLLRLFRREVFHFGSHRPNVR